MTMQHVGPIPHPRFPLAGVTPFTYRDGWTYLEVLENFRRWIRDELVPIVNDNAEKMEAAYEAALLVFLEAVNDFNDYQANLTQEFADFKADTNNIVQLIQDAAQEISDIFDDLQANGPVVSVDGTHGIVDLEPLIKAYTRPNTLPVGRGELVLNALDYGADPTATAADNVAAIQDALDAASGAGGGSVYLPPGPISYEINAPINMRSNTALIGDGATLKVLHDEDAVRVFGVQADRAHNVRIQGVKIDSNPTLGAGRGITLDHADDVWIESVDISNPGNNGITLRESTRVNINNCRIVADDYGIFIYRSQSVNVSNNFVDGAALCVTVKSSISGTDLPPNDETAPQAEDVDVTITGNNFHNYREHGISGGVVEWEGIVRGVTITGNTFRAWQDDTHLTAGSAVDSGSNARNWTVQGNTIIDGGTAGIALTGEQHSIVGNTISWRNVTPVAAGISGVSNSVITGNIITAPSIGIYTTNNTHDCIIMGNMIIEPLLHGVHINNTDGRDTSNIQVLNNRVINAVARGFYEQGTTGSGNIFRGNISTGAGTDNYLFVSPSTKRGMNAGNEAADPGTATGTDATVINNIVTALRQAGIVA